MKVILDRGDHCDYLARTTLKSLASKYWRYGGWKAEMILLHPSSIKLRHAVAPAFVLSLIILGVAGVLWTPARWFLLLEGFLYLSAALVASWRANIERERSQLLFLMPVVFATIHFTWGMTFLLRCVQFRKRSA